MGISISHGAPGPKSATQIGNLGRHLVHTGSVTGGAGERGRNPGSGYSASGSLLPGFDHGPAVGRSGCFAPGSWTYQRKNWRSTLDMSASGSGLPSTASPNRFHRSAGARNFLSPVGPLVPAMRPPCRCVCGYTNLRTRLDVWPQCGYSGVIVRKSVGETA